MTNTDKIPASLRQLYGHLSVRRKKQLVLVLVLMLIGAVAEVMTLGAIMPFLALIADPNSAAEHPKLREIFLLLGWAKPEQLLLPATVLFALTALVAGGLRILVVWASQKYIYRVGYDISIDVYQRTLYQPYSFHVSKNSGELLAAIGKVQSVVSNILSPVIQIIMSIIISIFIFSALISLDITVALSAAIGFALIYALITFLTRKKLKSNGRLIAKALDERIKTLQEGYGGIRDVIIDQAQDTYTRKYGRVDLALRDAQMINNFIGATPHYALQALAMVLIAGIAYVISIASGNIISSLPMLGALALGAQRLMPMLQQIYHGVIRIIGSYQVLLDVLDLLMLPVDRCSMNLADSELLPFNYEVKVTNLNFQYEGNGQNTLEDINLTIKKGERVGLIGKTGSGKSTILDLFLGLLEPSCGEITIDGVKLAPTNVRSWQSRIAHVPQTIYLSDTTVAENIAFGVDRDQIDMERVRDVARQADIAEHIEGLTNGYNTHIGERGIRLSGGQRQRIGIARALYKQADILVLDEATSALDNSTEKTVMEAIQGLNKQITTIIIAHRLSTIRHCDKVIKLNAGRILCTGTYDEVVGDKHNSEDTITEEIKVNAL